MTGQTAAQAPSELAAHVRMVAFDVDGTLTDGRIVVGNHGELAKFFSVHDGQGIRLLMDNGINVALITARESEIVTRRAAELRISHVLQGVADKAQALITLAHELGLSLEQTAFMGDDLPDLPAMRKAGLAACVANASLEVRQAAHWQSSQNSGHGAVREFAEFVLASQDLWEQAVSKYGAGSGAGQS